MACLFMWAPERHPAAPCMECSMAPLLWSTLKRKPSSECFLSPRGEYEVYYRFEYPVACFFCSRRFLQSKSTDRIASCSSRGAHRRRQAKTVRAVKRSKNPGFAGIDNELYVLDNTWMLFGDAKAVLADLVKQFGGGGIH